VPIQNVSTGTIDCISHASEWSELVTPKWLEDVEWLPLLGATGATRDGSWSRRNAARCGTSLLLATGALALACARPPAGGMGEAVLPGTCAWFGDARDGVLYFGESAFWHAMHEAGGDPRADAASTGPQVVGRFDLAREAMLPPLPAAASAHSGSWDVLAHPNGRVYFTSFYDPAGWVDPRSGRARLFASAGKGLNEIALLPDGRLLVTRYGSPDGGGGSVVVLGEDGAVEAEHPLAAEPGESVAAKSVAYDPVRGVAWVNTDVIPAGPGPTRHDARAIDLASGRELARFPSPELQFPRFAHDGRGWLAWLDGRRLVLRVTEPGEASGPESGRAIVLDDDFPAGLDFVQDVRDQPDGRVVATRWSGVVHVIEPDGRARTVRLPREEPGGWYYTAVATGERVCATYCAGVEVRCASLD
jgi:hypothetical protein